jgi:hypothetical protein
MNTNRENLDDAIDQVARQMTHVDDDAQFASRIVASLPERPNWFGWVTHSWVPGLAMIAIVVGAAALWNARHTTAVAPASQPIAGVQPIQPPSPVAQPIAPERVARVEPVRTKPVEPLELMEPLEPFEGLPPVNAPASVEIASLTAGDVPSEDALSVPSLVIADLPLTAESFPERD